jgi:uncharacterized protein YggT (Ycf19 family)
MTLFFSTLVIILIILKYIIVIDIILSWLTIFWIHFRPKIILEIIEPIYQFIKSKIPTTIGPIEFSSVIIIFFIIFLILLLLPLTGENRETLININNILI